MSRIDELVADLMPHGVGFKVLGDIAQLVRGNGMPKAVLTDNGVGAVHYGQIYTRYGVWATDTVSFVAPETAAKLTKVDPGDLIITNTSENIEDVGKAVAWLGERQIVTGGHATVLKHQLEPKYLSYWFASESFNRQKRKLASGTKVIDVSATQLAKIRIPVPPVEIQTEIVRILDQFSALISSLESEIEDRRAQRSALAINFAVASRDAGGHAMTQVNLGALASEVVDPIKVQPHGSYVSLGVKWNGAGVLTREPRSGADIKATTLYGVRPGQLVYNRMFVVEGSFALIPPECDGAVVSNEFPVFDIDTSVVEPEWLLHYLCDPYTLARIEAEVTGTERGTMKSRRRWKQDQFAKFDVELPALEQQREIVSVLQACDDLIGSLSDELAARRKQYGHYRDKLLTFGEASA